MQLLRLNLEARQVVLGGVNPGSGSGSGPPVLQDYDLLVGADGAGSAVRQALQVCGGGEGGGLGR